ncbi:VWA domain-containing protein [Psychromonas sp. CD1]|uniref:VWA domain-containing protein n=1 Tax=Psychromonas sp. CD1 TaxID=1979839 RepID=UPI0015DB669B|nr:VWA domain-containing protein [Psychromonas sp. CD1]
MLAENFLFLRPEWLLALFVIAGIALLRARRQHKNKKQPLIAKHLSQNLVHYGTQNKARYYFLYLLSIFTVIALSGPSWQKTNTPIYNITKAQVLVMDMSYSMYATDIKPNRLSQARYKAIDLIKAWSEGDKALIAYAGEAFTLSPLTSDGNAILNHIPNLKPEIMPVMGSHADAALKKAISLLKNAGYTNGHIVFITDDISPTEADKMLIRLEGTPWIVSVLAIATEQGAPISLNNGKLLKDEQGNIVVATLQKAPLLKITNATHGLYLAFQKNNQDVIQLSSYFKQQSAEKNNTQPAQHTSAIDSGYWFVFIIAVLFLGLFRKGFFYLLFFCVTLPLSSFNVEASLWKNTQQNAYQAYQNKDYTSATELYDKAFNKGAALYKNKKYKEALSAFTQALQKAPKNANIFYNQANSYAKLGQLDKAIQAYQHALTLQKNFKKARANKELVEQLNKQNKQKQKQKQSDNNSKDNKKSDKKQKKQSGTDSKNNNKSDKKQQQNKQQSQKQNSTSKKHKRSDSKQQENKNNESKNKTETPQKQATKESKKSTNKNKNTNKEKQNKMLKQVKNKPEANLKNTIALKKPETKSNKEYQALPNWLKNMPDDPSLLLQNKMRIEYQKRALSQPVPSQNNGIIW